MGIVLSDSVHEATGSQTDSDLSPRLSQFILIGCSLVFFFIMAQKFSVLCMTGNFSVDHKTMKFTIYLLTNISDLC